MLEPAASYPAHTNEISESRCCGEAKDRVLLDRFGTSWYVEILFGSAVLKPWASPCSPRYFRQTPGLTC